SNDFYVKQTKDFNKARYFNTFVSFIRDAISYGYLSLQIILNAITIGEFTMYFSALAQFSGAMNDVMSSILDMKQFGAYYNDLEK
ncbi:MAG: ABC transporter ATP-binding protein, partial [Clostridia bacterium]|nr:ABC transporter ATP-binding protein [Clostridia bacterium]